VKDDAVARGASRLRAGRLSRRGFLVASAAVVVGGCGVDEAGKAPPTDEEVLRGLLPVELAAGAAVVGAAGADLMARQDARHAERLAALAGVPVPAARSTAVDLATALARKQEALFAYVAALPQLADPAARVAVMQILASEAEQLAALRPGPLRDAFAGFAA
jgi:hypothetical protein